MTDKPDHPLDEEPTSSELMVTLDHDDEAVYAHAFVLADAVRRFLSRHWVKQILALWADDRIVDELVAANERMTELRMARLSNARQEPTS